MSKKIAIIGGGVTGLVLAYRLVNEGHKVFVYERSRFLGGLASGFEIQGNYLEKAYHHLFSTDVDIINLVDELGLNDSLKWYKSSMSIYYEGKIYPFTSPIDLLKFSPLNIIDRLRTGLAIFYLQKKKKWKSLENISAYEWMEKYAGKNSTKVIWGPLLKGKFHSYYQDVSMAWLWARLHIRANSRQSKGTEEKLGYFNGGFQVLVNKLEQEILNKGGKILKNVNVNSLNKTKITFSNVEGGESDWSEIFDKVVCTTPSTVFANIISKNHEVKKKYLERLNSISYLGAVCAVFTSDQKLSQYYWHNINDTKFPFLIFAHHTQLVPREQYRGKYIYYLGTYIPNDHKYFTQTDEEIFSEWFNYLAKIFPVFDSKSILERYLFRFKNAQHIVDKNYREKIPSYKTPIKDVYLSNFSQIYPEDRGTNFSVREGNKLAKIIFS